MRKIPVILFIALNFNAFSQDKSVQLTGILVSTDSLLTIPFANVLIKNKEQGTISDFYGYFSLVAMVKDARHHLAAFFLPTHDYKTHYKLLYK